MVTDAATATATKALTVTVTITASVLSGITIYDAQCAGCHGAGIYDTSNGSANLGLTTLSAINAEF
jgi:mono/diheme cytochrome c family protein